MWRQVTVSRILRGLDAALVILHIGTAPRVSQQVHQDEAYERVVTLSRFHLETNIYPEFDPIYKAGEYACLLESPLYHTYILMHIHTYYVCIYDTYCLYAA